MSAESGESPGKTPPSKNWEIRKDVADSSVVNTAVGDAKTRQMDTQHQDNTTPLTTYFGTKIAETDVALRAGARGPTVLEGMSTSSQSSGRC
jgi:hypothetical protein